MAHSRFHINPDTTGALFVIRGRSLLFYPASRFEKKSKKWEFSRTPASSTGYIHLGLFGICWARATTYPKREVKPRVKVHVNTDPGPEPAVFTE